MIIEKNRLFKQFHKGHERKKDISTITLHGSAGGQNAAALFKWWNSLPDLTDEWSIKKLKKMKNGIGFYHFVIDLDGTIFNTHDIKRWFYSSHSGFMDSTNIQICLVNTQVGNLAEYTEKQYQALNELIEYLFYKIGTIEKIDTHSVRAMKYSKIEPPTPCPGPIFDRLQLWDFSLNLLF